MILLFGQTRKRFYYSGENEKTILLFSMGREYDFTEIGGIRMWSPGTAFFVLAVVLTILFADHLGSGNQLVDAGL